MFSPKSLVKPLLLGVYPKYLGRRNKPDVCKKYIKVNHVIFDLDGAILDNQEMLDKAYQAVFEKFGITYTYEWRLKIMGMTGYAMWSRVAHDAKSNVEWHKMYEYYREVIKGSLKNAPLRPGIERLINHLAQSKVPMAVVTSSTEATMEVKTKHIESLMSKFSHVVAAGDDGSVRKSKPSGQVFGICAGRFLGKPEPHTCLVFEDTPNGVMAASCACMQVIGVPSPPTTVLPSIAFANETVNTLHDFWPGKYGLPPFPEQVHGSPPPPRF